MNAIPRYAFVISAIIGAALALAGLFLPASLRLPGSDPAVARVNDQSITEMDLATALSDMAVFNEAASLDTRREQALNRLIDEELLYQRAVELDLPRNSGTLRRSIIIAMSDAIRAAAVREPEEAELRALFASEPELFSGETYLQIVWLTGAASAETLQRPAAHPPDRLLPATQLRGYLGENLTLAALSLAPGERSERMVIEDRAHQLTLIDRAEATSLDFEQQRETIEALWYERQQASALAAYLADLRNEAEIAIRE